MKKDIEVKSREAAWDMVNTLFPADYLEDSESVERAGYPIYRSTIEHYDYICDLGNRLEINLKEHNQTINIWIIAEEGGTGSASNKGKKMIEHLFRVTIQHKTTGEKIRLYVWAGSVEEATHQLTGNLIGYYNEYSWLGSGPVYENNNVVTRERK